MMSRKLALTIFVAAALALGFGCGTSATPTPPNTTDTPPPPTGDTPSVAHGDTPPVGDAPPAAAGAVIRDVGFELRATAAGPYHAGQAGSFGVALTPQGEYHVNQEYPIRVTVHAPDGVTLPKATLERPDAAEFDERKARFDVPFTAASAGERRVEVQVDFAVCTAQNCMPDQRTLALALPVE